MCTIGLGLVCRDSLHVADPDIIVRHQPMIFGSDRISSAYTAINRLPSYAKPSYLLTFNEPNYANAGVEDTNIMDPATAARLWPQLTSRFDPLGIQLIAPSPITCSGDPNCRNVGTAAGWLSEFQEVRFATSNTSFGPTVITSSCYMIHNAKCDCQP